MESLSNMYCPHILYLACKNPVIKLGLILAARLILVRNIISFMVDALLTAGTRKVRGLEVNHAIYIQ